MLVRGMSYLAITEFMHYHIGCEGMSLTIFNEHLGAFRASYVNIAQTVVGLHINLIELELEEFKCRLNSIRV